MIAPWEIHPALNHFPIAFLIGGVALDLYARWRRKPSLNQVATGLLIAGLITGILTALAGLLAFFTVPGHTDEAHRLMYWHMVIQAVALVLFAWSICKRWRVSSESARPAGLLISCIAAMMLLAGSGIGGYLVYHGGAGVMPELLAAPARHHEHGAGINQHKHELHSD